MPRYFIEVSYMGSAYSGFQVQKNSDTIQSEVEKALRIFFRRTFSLTGASRTDSGVHALQNYFHFDNDEPLPQNKIPKEFYTSIVRSPAGTVMAIRDDVGETGFLYNLNSILPHDIVIKRIFQVAENAHCRFDAVSREYKYFIYSHKDPFVEDRAYYFPYKLDLNWLNEAATLILQNHDFTSFSKRNTQVNNFICEIMESKWIVEKEFLVYNVKANRFLRGMVKGMVGTMLRVGAGKISLQGFNKIIQRRDCDEADFSVPSHALFLASVNYNRF